MLHLNKYYPNWLAGIVFVVLGVFVASPAVASHIAGGYMHYSVVSSTSSGVTYDVTLTIYYDFTNGSPDAISQDDPAFFAVYQNTASAPLAGLDTTAYHHSDTLIPAIVVDPCGTGLGFPQYKAKQFTARFTLANSSTGYVVAYQRCCYTAALSNVASSSNIGETIFCTIPPVRNNNPVPNQYPQRALCINSAAQINLSATDADGDSLSYEFVQPYNGASENDVKPFPAPPTYGSVGYVSPSVTANPLGIGTGMSIDPATGIVSCTPDHFGNYLLAVNYHEWRHGVMINTTPHTFTWVVTNCSGLPGVSVTSDTTIFVGTTLNLWASGGVTYQWLNTLNLSDSAIANPAVGFPDAGTFSYPVRVTTAAGCIAVDTVVVTVLDTSEVVMPTAFTPNNDGVNDVFTPIAIGPNVIKTFKVFNVWGNLVHSGAASWDGTYHGKKAETGVYVWVLVYENSVGKSVTKKGNVTLLR